jgi:hypothetical protein
MAVAIRHPSRALAVLAVALPIPLLAAAGLSLPLPVTIERLAAKLVPFGNQAAIDAGRGDRPAQGSIVLAPGDQRLAAQATVMPARLGRHRASAVPRLIGAPTSHSDGRRPGVNPERTDRSPSTPGATSNTGTAPAPSSGATTPSTATPSTSSSAPAPTTTTTTTTTTTPTTTPSAPPIVNTVTTAVNNTVTTATNTANNTVTTVTNPVGGVVGGLKHP